MNNKPNILFIISDQFNAKCLSCAGHPNVKTPNIDSLASGGVRFTNAYAQSPVCTPSRISFISGLYPSTHGYYGLYGREPDFKMTSLFRYFRENGYRTGALGKLHTPRYWIERDSQFVYDEFIEFPKYLEAVGLYEKNDNRGFTGWRYGEASALPLEHTCESLLARQTLRFIDNLGEPNDRGSDDAPWFAWVSFARPHGPITPSEPFASMYPSDSIDLPPSAIKILKEGSSLKKRVVPHFKGEPDEKILRKVTSSYLGLVTQVDYWIGEILEEVKKRGILENTIIVFTADHGDYAGEHGMWSKYGGISYRAITNIPLVLSWPNHMEKGKLNDNVVEAIDLFPTLCQLTGIKTPDHLQGKSIVNQLSDIPPDPLREDALTENAYRKALATKRWRYVANINGEEDELYDQHNDPWEMNNLINDPRYRETAKILLRRLMDRVVRARRPIVSYDNGTWYHEYDRDGRSDLRHEMEKEAAL